MKIAKVNQEEVEKIEKKILELLRLLKDCGANINLEKFDLRYITSEFLTIEERNEELFRKLGISLIGLGEGIYHCIVNYWSYFVPPEEVLRGLDKAIEAVKKYIENKNTFK